MEIKKLLQTYLPPEQQEQLSDLTPEEEKMAINHAIYRKKAHWLWKQNDRNRPKNKTEELLKNIDWENSINKDEVINLAKRLKFFELSDKDYCEKQKALSKEKMDFLINEWNYKKFFIEIKNYFVNKNGGFILNKHNEMMVKAVCYFFSANSKFETELGFSFNKGLLLYGSAGLGKTEIIKAIQGNPIKPIGIISILDITDTIKTEGFFELNNKFTYLIDDVGTESEMVNYFGTKVNWFQDFIQKWYIDGSPFNNLIITTNLGGDELEKKYGYRVRSRIREMFNCIEVKGNDLRK